MGLLDDYNYENGIIGLGMTARPAKRHQQVMSNLITNINLRLLPAYQAIGEPGIEVENREKAPDVGIYKTFEKPHINHWQLVSFIEIVKTMPEEKKIRARIENVLDKWGVQEALIYNYTKNHWVKCTNLPKKQRNANTAFSDVLQLNLEPLTQFVVKP